MRNMWEPTGSAAAKKTHKTGESSESADALQEAPPPSEFGGIRRNRRSQRAAERWSGGTVSRTGAVCFHQKKKTKREKS